MTDYNIGDLTLGLNPQALSVLALLSQLEPGYANDGTSYLVSINTAAFYNGRERGFVISQWAFDDARENNLIHLACVECRRSDDIVVYQWDSMAKGINPPVIEEMPEEAWKNRKLFGYGQSGKVADYICTQLKEHYQNRVNRADK